MALVFNPFTGTFDFVGTGGGGGGITSLAANNTPTTGFTAGQYLYSDGTLLQAKTFGTGVSTALGNAVDATGGLITFAALAPATIARTDQAQTFTMVQTFSSQIVSPTTNASTVITAPALGAL